MPADIGLLVNTEIRSAYSAALAKSFANASHMEMINRMQTAIDATKQSVRAKITLFCSADKASATTQS